MKNKQRTVRQNSAIHKFFELLAFELNTAGLDARKVLKPSYQVWWTPEMIKRDLWCQLQDVMVSKKHTSELTRQEVDKIYEQLMQMLGEKWGIYVPFPSNEPPLLEEI